MEDLQKPAYDFKKNKVSDKLPHIEYGSLKQLSRQVVPVQLHVNPQQASSTHNIKLLDLNSLQAQDNTTAPIEDSVYSRDASLQQLKQLDQVKMV